MLTMARTTLAVLVVLALLGESATGAALHEHRHQRSRDHFARLHDTVDRLLLRQKIDHILLTNLQRTVQQLQERSTVPEEVADASTRSETPFAASLRMMEAEGRALSALGARVTEMRGTMTQALESEQHRDDVTQLRQELANLRSEVQRLKTSRASESEASAAHVHAREQREAVTAAWVVGKVQHLQDSVAELQRSFNVTQAMHDKQEVESRLLVVTKDLSALRGTLAGVTSKAEAAAATSEALQEELARTSEDQHRLAGRVAALNTEVSTIREDFDDLLKALPEGTVAGTPASPPGLPDEKSSAAATSATRGVAVAVAQAAHLRQQQRVVALEQRADSLDFALTRAQNKLSSLSPGSGIEARVAEVAEAERQLEMKTEAATTGVREVRSSSVKLLAALEALEARMEKEVAEVKQEVAKMEFTVAQTAAERQSGQQDARVAHDDTSALRSDLQAVSRHLEEITLKTAALEGRKLDDDITVAQCRAQQLTFDLRLTDTLERLQHVEQRLRQCHSQGAHKHHLAPWRDSADDAPGENKRGRRSASPSG